MFQPKEILIQAHDGVLVASVKKAACVERGLDPTKWKDVAFFRLDPHRKWIDKVSCPDHPWLEPIVEKALEIPANQGEVLAWEAEQTEIYWEERR